MREQISDQQLLETLSQSSKGIAELLRSAGHPARIQILTLLLEGKQDFSHLKSATALSKTALANHLHQLIEERLVKRVARGEYSLTTDGKALLNAVAITYRNSTRRIEARTEQLRKRYTKGLIEGKELSKNVISKEAEYQPCWLSYTGAIAGSLRTLGIDCDIVDVGGRSGYGFIINVSKGDTCPSGPTALPPDTWKQIHAGTEALGWTMEHYEYPSSYPAEEGKPTPQEIEVARKLFEKIKAEIDERDRPVVLWGLVAPEYGIVNGYEATSYIPSTFRRLINQPEDPIPFYDLKAPGCIDAFFFRDRVEVDAAVANRKALERAIRFATADVPILENYVAGPQALEEWANVLEHVPEEKQNYMGNSYVGACVWEGRAMAAEFLQRLATQHPEHESKTLRRAAESYQKGIQLMKDFTQLFPFKHQGEMKPEHRKRGADLLRKVKPYEEEAIKDMKHALDRWETA